MSRITLIALTTLILTGCQKARQYPAADKEAAAKVKKVSVIGSWVAPKTSPDDAPIEFVSSDRPEWRTLPLFWNTVQPPRIDAGKIQIKVPLGLPDPTPLIPAINPPTLAKWRLGKKVFFEKALTETPAMSCADCHKPSYGFTEDRYLSDEGTRNTLSLLNVAYNRDQFWDGRVRSLEETLMPLVDDAGDPSSRLKALQTHRFAGVADRLDKNPDYRAEFKEAFGIDRVTQDAVAKSLATYLRTILSGDSVYDRAKAAIPPFKDATPTVEQFKSALDADAIKRMTAALPQGQDVSPDALAAKIALGQTLFLGKAGCVRCHPLGLFTNHQYYNTLIADAGRSQTVAGKETGRFAVLPIGLKDFSMRGAYRTPTLRNLSSTAPYMHDGHYSDLRFVIEHYSVNLNDKNPLLAQPLRDVLTEAGNPNSILSLTESEALLHFLLALNGQPVDPWVR